MEVKSIGFSKSVRLAVNLSTRESMPWYLTARAPLDQHPLERRRSTFCCFFLRKRERVHLSPHIPSDPAFARWSPLRLAHGASVALSAGISGIRTRCNRLPNRAFSPFSLGCVHGRASCALCVVGSFFATVVSHVTATCFVFKDVAWTTYTRCNLI